MFRWWRRLQTGPSSGFRGGVIASCAIVWLASSQCYVVLGGWEWVSGDLRVLGVLLPGVFGIAKSQCSIGRRGGIHCLAIPLNTPAPLMVRYGRILKNTERTKTDKTQRYNTNNFGHRTWVWPVYTCCSLKMLKSSQPEAGKAHVIARGLKRLSISDVALPIYKPHLTANLTCAPQDSYWFVNFTWQSQSSNF